jgi:hypothetical protein
LKDGQGPGETHNLGTYFLDGGRLRVQSWIPPKILDYDLNGRFLREEKIGVLSPFHFLGVLDGQTYGVIDDIRTSETIYKEGFQTILYHVYEIDREFKKLTRIYDLPMEIYIKKARWWKRGAMLIAPWKHCFFIAVGQVYRVIKLNPRTGAVEAEFKRPYRGPKTGPDDLANDKFDRVPRGNGPPPMEYDFDVFGIQVHDDLVWVITSTVTDDGNRCLVDVFDSKGRWTDSFNLQFPTRDKIRRVGDIAISSDGSLFIPEVNRQDGLMSLARYRMIDH